MLAFKCQMLVLSIFNFIKKLLVFTLSKSGMCSAEIGVSNAKMSSILKAKMGFKFQKWRLGFMKWTLDWKIG